MSVYNHHESMCMQNSYILRANGLSQQRQKWLSVTFIGVLFMTIFVLFQFTFRLKHSSLAPQKWQVAEALFRHTAHNNSGIHTTIGEKDGKIMVSVKEAAKALRKAERRSKRRSKRQAAKKAKRQSTRLDVPAPTTHQSITINDNDAGSHQTLISILSAKAQAVYNVNKEHKQALFKDCLGRKFSTESCSSQPFFPESTLGCQEFLHDELCDIGQYPTDSGQQSPNLNCTKFDFDNGHCINIRADKSRLKASWPDARIAEARAFLKFQNLNTTNNELVSGETIYSQGRSAVMSNAKYLPFLFLKDYKTASEAVYSTLFKFVKGVCVQGKLTNLNDYCATGKLGHGSISVVRDQLQRLVGVDVDEIFTFSVVRNPYDRQVSWFFWDFYRKNRNLRRHRNFTNETKKAFREYILGQNAVNAKHYEAGANHHQVLSSDAFLGMPPAGRRGKRERIDKWDFPHVSRILRYENLEDDVRKLLLELGVPKAALPSRNLLNQVSKKLLHSTISTAFSNNRHYRDFYDNETLEIVRAANKRTIELFNYSF